MTCVLNVATKPFYTKWQERLSASLTTVGYNGRRLFWTNSLPPESPTQEESPYAFKLYAIKEAMKQKETRLLWVDAGLYAIRPLDPIFEILEREGVYLMRDENKVAKFCSQETLDYYSVTRESMAGIHLVTGAIIGLNMESDVSRGLLEEWRAAYGAGLYRGTVSRHSEQEDHRGDETILGILAHRKGLNLHGLGDHHTSDCAVRPTTIFRSGYYDRTD